MHFITLLILFLLLSASVHALQEAPYKFTSTDWLIEDKNNKVTGQLMLPVYATKTWTLHTTNRRVPETYDLMEIWTADWKNAYITVQ